MTHHRNQHDVAIANVSRRNLLKGVAGTGVFVLAAQFPAIRSAMAYADRRRRNGARRRHQPARLRFDR